MSNEATVQSTLAIRSGNLNYQSQPTSFRADVAGAKGPTPGAIAVTVLGTSVSLAELTTPGLCRIMNLDATNYVEWGPYDPTSNTFFPVGELLPGESYIFRLYRLIGEEAVGTGTAFGNTILRLRAVGATCNVLVEAFEK